MDNIFNKQGIYTEHIQNDFNGVVKDAIKVLMQQKNESLLQKNNTKTVVNKVGSFVKTLIPKITKNIEEQSPYLKDLKLVDNLLSVEVDNEKYLDFIVSNVKVLAQKYILDSNITNELDNSVKNYQDITQKIRMSLSSNAEDSLQFKEKIIRQQEAELTKIHGYTKAILKIIQKQAKRKEEGFEGFYEEYIKLIIENEFNKILEKLELSNELGLPLSVLINSGEDSLVNEESSDKYIQDILENKKLTSSVIRAKMKEENVLSSLYSSNKTFNNDFMSYLSLFKNNKPLLDLLDSLGKKMGLEQSQEENNEEKYIAQRRSELESKSYREKVAGITFDKDFEYMLPHELALLSDPEVELLFEIKFLENRVTCFDLDSVSNTFDEEIKTRQSVKEKVHPERGPVIICLDTSGSMRGMPDNYAKAITLVLALKCFDAHRDMYIINFSDDILCMKFESRFKNKAIYELQQFLLMSYNGSTENMNATLTEVLDRMANDEVFQKADMLCCTDANYTSSISIDLINQAIEMKKQNQNGFYELIVGKNPYPDPLFFDTIYTISNGKLGIIECEK